MYCFVLACFFFFLFSYPNLNQDFVVRAVCPQIYGLFTVKLALLLTLTGGVPQADASGMPVRCKYTWNGQCTD